MLAGGTGTVRPVDRLPYLPGVDGLRAVAVVAVVLYHADVVWLPAGFLGVDVFFVISGYLIASLLLSEHAATGTVAVGDFWRRRARRLLPGLFAVLAGTTIASLTIARDAAGRLAGDLPANLLYVGNWWQIVRGESYFESIGRPPLLRHLWSLAVEEQFYVAVPVVVGAVLARRAPRRTLAVGALALALLSALWMAVLWSPVDASRVYFGTDTRATPLLLGVALAAWWRPGRLSAGVRPGARAVLDLAGAAALAALVVVAATADEFGPGLYRGGFLLVAALAAVAVAVAAHPASRFGAALGRRPLVWLGRRSYAIYLWHWPVVVLTRPGIDIELHGAPLLALRLLITLLLADLSYGFVEQPFRDGRAQQAFRARPTGGRRRIAAVVAGASAAGWLGVVLVDGPVGDRDLVAAVATQGPVSTLATWPSTTTSTTTTTATTAPPTTAAPPVAAAPAVVVAPPTTAPPPPPPPPAPVGPPAGPVLAVGDSVLLASAAAVERASNGMVQVDAAVGRQVWDTLEVLERYRTSGAFANLSALVVHLGTNGPLTPPDLDRLAMAVAGVPRVLVLTVRVPKRWEGTTNSTIGEGVPRFGFMRAVDWYGTSGQPGMLGPDGVHPTRQGMDAYARIILEQLGDLPPPPPPPPPPETTTTAPPPPPPPPETTTTPPPPPPTTTTAAAVG